MKTVALFYAAYPGLDPRRLTPGLFIRLAAQVHYVFDAQGGRLTADHEGAVAVAERLRSEAIERRVAEALPD